jgi:hypothetical protein
LLLLEKDCFFAPLQDPLSAIPSNKCFVREAHDERWYEKSPHKYGEINEAGKKLLSLLSSNEARVCNTWFQKWDIYKQTWQHPKSQKWHCI